MRKCTKHITLRVDRLSNFEYRGIEERPREIGVVSSMLGYVSDGNFYETTLFDGAKESDKVDKYVHDMVHRAIEIEETYIGSISHFLLAIVVTNIEYIR